MNNEAASASSGVQVYLRLVGYITPYWGRLALALVAMVVVAGTTTAIAYLLKPVIDEIFINKNETLLLLLPVAVMGLYLIKGVANFLQMYLLRWVGQRAMRELRDDLFSRIIRLPLAFFSHHSTGSLVSRLTYDVDQVERAITQGVTTLLKDSLTACFLLGLIFYHDWRMALISLVGLPLVIGPLVRLTRKLRKSNRVSQEARAAMTRVLNESLLGNRIVKAFNGEPNQQRRFHEQAEFHRRQNMRKAQASALLVPLMEFVGSLCIAVVIYYGGHRVIAGGGSPGTFFSFLVALLMLYEPLKRLTRINDTLQQGIAASERICEMLDWRQEPNHGGYLMEKARGELRFENVYFGYEPNRPVLHDINLTVPAGRMVALVGHSGSGKSSLINLVPRFYPVEHGRITLDGIDIDAIELTTLRDQIALVSQEIVLFNETVATNIACGRPSATRSELVDAAEAAGVMEFARHLRKGLDHPIGEGGVNLSGGQRQRLAIARALIRDAPILILDEATSNLDPYSERYVQQGLQRLMEARTTLVIAHRLATVERADSVAVMEAGRIVEQGSHTELLQQGAAYAHLWATEFAHESTTETNAA